MYALDNRIQLIPHRFTVTYGCKTYAHSTKELYTDIWYEVFILVSYNVYIRQIDAYGCKWYGTVSSLSTV